MQPTGNHYQRHRMGKRVAKTHCDGTWTASQYRSFIKSGLRRMSFRWRPKTNCKKAARLPQKQMGKNGRLVFFSKCELCKEEMPETMVEVDHKEPVVPIEGFSTWDEVIDRLFCDSDGLRVLCKPCHKEVTKKQRQQAALHRKLKK